MSSRRGSPSARFTEEEINDLIIKLQELLQHSSSRSTSRIPASKIVEETCNYIKTLQREVDDLTERLSQMLDNNPNFDLHTIRNFLQRYLEHPTPTITPNTTNPHS